MLSIKNTLFSHINISRVLVFLATILSFCMCVLCGDMMRKSIVFDKKTPGVFYCPLSKPTGFEKLYVHSKPLKKLCEFDGKPLPEDYKSDCWNDVDETEYACKEKYRIMKRYNKKTEGAEPNPFEEEKRKCNSKGRDHSYTYPEDPYEMYSLDYRNLFALLMRLSPPGGDTNTTVKYDKTFKKVKAVKKFKRKL